jgi:putative restriction endonuclease
LQGNDRRLQAGHGYCEYDATGDLQAVARSADRMQRPVHALILSGISRTGLQYISICPHVCICRQAQKHVRLWCSSFSVEKVPEEETALRKDCMELEREFSLQRIREHLHEITRRLPPLSGQRQVPFNLVEKALCYGLFYLCNPHKYGGANIQTVPDSVKQLAAFCRRTHGSITNKMLNLEGARSHTAREEPELFAAFASDQHRYRRIYQEILTQARDLLIGEETLPDFLHLLAPETYPGDLLVGQEDLPASTTLLLAHAEEAMKGLQRAFFLSDRQTEKIAEQKIRLAQHRFALEVIRNCGGACVFCGFAPHTLHEQSHLLRASHIKPWADSTDRERVNVQNGLAACPMHDVAFDRGYLMINGGYRIHRATRLAQSIVSDPKVTIYFGETLSPVLLLPQHAKRPGHIYLAYHRENIFKG